MSGRADRDALIHDWNAYCRRAAELIAVPIPSGHPLLGEAAFRTATGVHAAAIRKAGEKDAWLAERVYGAVPSSAVGRAQEVLVGPMSGRANVEHWLALQAIPANEALIFALLAYARASDHVLDDQELLGVVQKRDES